MAATRKRVLYVFGEFPPWMYQKDGGQIPKWLARGGYEVTMLMSDPGHTEMLSQIGHLRTVRFRHYLKVQLGLVINPMMWAYLLVHARATDLMFAFWARVETPFALAAKVLWRKKLVLKMDSDGHVRETPLPYPRPLNWLIFALSDLIIIESPEARARFVSEFPLVVKKVICLSNGFPDHEYPETRQGGDKTNRGHTILFVGVESKRKGVDLLMEAFGRLSRKHEGWTLKLVGETTETVSELARQLDAKYGTADRIQVTGRLSRRDLETAYHDAEIFCLPSRKEASSIALLEAMSFGKAIVASDAGSARYVLDYGKAGILVPAGDLEALEKALELLMSNEELREDMGERARRRAVERLSWGSMVEQLGAELDRRGLLVAQ